MKFYVHTHTDTHTHIYIYIYICICIYICMYLYCYCKKGTYLAGGLIKSLLLLAEFCNFLSLRSVEEED
ncbi:hypothetical protein Hanom_Chr04g00290661 [Helianthus anomalus]